MFDFKFFQRKPDTGTVSLSDYFDDTVSTISRKNKYNKHVNLQDIDDELTTQQGVTQLLLEVGVGIVAMSRQGYGDRNIDEIESPLTPGLGAVVLAKRTGPLSLEESVLMACHFSREAYGLKTVRVHCTPNEISQRIELINS